MVQIGNDPYNDENNEADLEAFSEFLDLQMEVLTDSGDLDVIETQFFATKSNALLEENGFEQSSAYIEGLSKISVGDLEDSIKLRVDNELGVPSLDVYRHIEIASATEEIDELEYRRFAEEQNLLDHDEFGPDNP